MSDGSVIRRRPAISMEPTRAAAGAFGSSQLEIDHHFLPNAGPVTSPAFSAGPLVSAGPIIDVSNSLGPESVASRPPGRASTAIAQESSSISERDAAGRYGDEANRDRGDARDKTSGLQVSNGDAVAKNHHARDWDTEQHGHADDSATTRPSSLQPPNHGKSATSAWSQTPANGLQTSPTALYGRVRSGRLGEDDGGNDVSSIASSPTLSQKGW